MTHDMMRSTIKDREPTVALTRDVSQCMSRIMNQVMTAALPPDVTHATHVRNPHMSRGPIQAGLRHATQGKLTGIATHSREFCLPMPIQGTVKVQIGGVSLRPNSAFPHPLFKATNAGWPMDTVCVPARDDPNGTCRRKRSESAGTGHN